eukprot:870661-Rhodomonas_salina.2
MPGGTVVEPRLVLQAVPRRALLEPEAACLAVLLPGAPHDLACRIEVVARDQGLAIRAQRAQWALEALEQPLAPVAEEARQAAAGFDAHLPQPRAHCRQPLPPRSQPRASARLPARSTPALWRTRGSLCMPRAPWRRRLVCTSRRGTRCSQRCPPPACSALPDMAGRRGRGSRCTPRRRRTARTAAPPH